MADAKSKTAKPATKTVMYQELAERTGLTKKQVGSLFDELAKYIEEQLGKKGPGVVNIPPILKIKKLVKKAQPARQGRNPQTGEPMTYPPKPKRTVPKAYALKALKEMVKA